MSLFFPCCHSMLIGSMPHYHHLQALDAIFSFTPSFPCWPQLPNLPGEDMISQFLPEIDNENNKTASMSPQYEPTTYCLEWEAKAKGFQLFFEHAKGKLQSILKVKGQLTGPLTLFFTTRDQKKFNSVHYDYEALTVYLEKIATYQVNQLQSIKSFPIILIDEPLLGTTSFTNNPDLSVEKNITGLKRIIFSIRKAGGLPGIHVCSKPDWPALFKLAPDIISFDSSLLQESITDHSGLFFNFFKKGGILAHGLIPTQEDQLVKSSKEKLVESFFSIMDKLEKTGLGQQTIYQQSIITPSCGLGRTPLKHARESLVLMKNVSQTIRNHFRTCQNTI